jgi:hypothetical protein
MVTILQAHTVIEKRGKSARCDAAQYSTSHQENYEEPECVVSSMATQDNIIRAVTETSVAESPNCHISKLHLRCIDIAVRWSFNYLS